MLIHTISNDDIYTGLSYEYPGPVAPYNATTIDPPPHQEGYARKFIRQALIWDYVPLEELQPPPPSLEEAKAQKIIQIDSETSNAITSGFIYEVEGVPYHFSYDSFDQQNFVDTATVATLLLANNGAPEDPDMPTAVTWNAYTIPDDELIRLIFSPAEFLSLYTHGALAHKGMQMEIGGQRKEAVKNATTIEEVNGI